MAGAFGHRRRHVSVVAKAVAVLVRVQERDAA
jgi:hypothetical protein